MGDWEEETTPPFYNNCPPQQGLRRQTSDRDVVICGVSFYRSAKDKLVITWKQGFHAFCTILLPNCIKKRIYVLQVIWTLSSPSCVHHLLPCHWGKRRRLISSAFFPFYWRAVLQGEQYITWIVCASLLPVSNCVSLSPSSRLEGAGGFSLATGSSEFFGEGKTSHGGACSLSPLLLLLHPLTTPKWPLTLSSVYIRAWKWEIVMSHSSRVFTLWSHARKEISHGLLKVERWEGCCDLPLRLELILRHLCWEKASPADNSSFSGTEDCGRRERPTEKVETQSQGSVSVGRSLHPAHCLRRLNHKKTHSGSKY